MGMRQSITARAQRKWPGVPLVDKLMDIEADKRCIVLGTVYKEMKLKPNILDEFQAREVCVRVGPGIGRDGNASATRPVHTNPLPKSYEAPPPERSKYNAEDDSIVLEDQTARVSLLGPGLPVGELVTGACWRLGSCSSSACARVVWLTSPLPSAPRHCYGRSWQGGVYG
jgi:DNA polymerase delta subunit 2